MRSSMERADPKFFRTASEWREWLARNHDKEAGVWLVHCKKGSRKKGISHPEAVDEALCYGWIDSRLRSHDEDTYILRYTPRKKNSVWSEVNRTGARRLIREGRMTEAGLLKVGEAKKNGMWATAYSSAREPSLPSDLRGALAKDGRSLRIFRSLSNTKKTAAVFWVMSAKRENTRKKRIATIVKKVLDGGLALP